MISDMLAEVGISIHIETVSYDECKTVLENGGFDLALCSFQISQGIRRNVMSVLLPSESK